MSLSTGQNGGAGVSLNGTVDAASAILIPKGSYQGAVVIQNTHASNILYLSFNAAATTSDFKLAPGASLVIPYGLMNDLSGIGSAAGTTWAAIGL